MRRCLPRFALLALLVFVTFFYPLLAPTAHRIDQAHFDLIKGGMTKAEVEAIFGVPAGEYDWASVGMPPALFDIVKSQPHVGWSIQTTEGTLRSRASDSGNSHERTIPHVWLGRHGVCTIHIDNRQRATEFRYFWPHVEVEPPWNRWWARLRNQQ